MGNVRVRAPHDSPLLIAVCYWEKNPPQWIARSLEFSHNRFRIINSIVPTANCPLPSHEYDGRIARARRRESRYYK